METTFDLWGSDIAFIVKEFVNYWLTFRLKTFLLPWKEET